MSEKHFQEAYARICEVTGCTTQEELAEYLGIRQSSISDAKRRCAVPDGWLVTLVEKEGVSPAWIRDGIGPKLLKACSIVKYDADDMPTDSLLATMRRRFTAVNITL